MQAGGAIRPLFLCRKAGFFTRFPAIVYNGMAAIGEGRTGRQALRKT
jgi:hypothetical protein